MAGGKKDDEDFLELVTGVGFGFAHVSSSLRGDATASDLAKTCQHAPQLVTHMSKMIQDPNSVVPELSSVQISAFEPDSHSLKWPRRGGL